MLTPVELIELNEPKKSPFPGATTDLLRIQSNHNQFSVALKIKNKLKECSMISTTHGIPNIIRNPNKSLKLIWTICFLASTVTCAFLVLRSVSEYFEFDVVTKTRVFNQAQSSFPSITICDLNAFSTQFSASFLKQIMIEEFGKDLTLENLTTSQFIQNFSYIQMKAIRKAFMPEFGDENRKALGIPLEDSLYYCNFDSFDCLNNFTWHYDYSYGNCYTLEPPQTKNTGEFTGLFMIFFLPNSSNKYAFSISKGLKVFIQNSSYLNTFTDGIEIRPSTKTNIGLKRTFSAKTPSPYSDCVDTLYLKPYIYYYFSNSSKFYRQSDCLSLCKQKQIVDKCNCYIMVFPKWGNYSPCVNDTEMICAGKEFELYDKIYYKNCDLDCPLECDSSEIEYVLSNSDFPNEIFWKYDRNNPFFRGQDLDYDEYKSRALALNIYFKTLQYTLITESAKSSIVELFSNIGGTLGLFLGISLLSFVEIIELVLEILFVFLYK